MTPQASLIALITCLLAVTTMGLGLRSTTSTTRGSAYITGSEVAVGDPAGLIAARTTSGPRHVIGGKNAGSRDTTRKSSSRKDKIKKKSRHKIQLRMLDYSDKCMRWEPKLNLTTDPHIGLIVVDYCLSGKPVPETETCLIPPGRDPLCIFLNPPVCRHDFENLTAGNYAVRITPKCPVCFDSVVSKKECQTAIFLNFVILDNITSQEEQPSVTVKDGVTSQPEQRAVIIKDNATSSRNNHQVIVIASASLGSTLLVLALLVAFIVHRRRSNRPDTSSSSGQASSYEMCAWKTCIKKHQLNSSPQQVASEALLGDPHRQGAREVLLGDPHRQGAREVLLGDPHRQVGSEVLLNSPHQQEAHNTLLEDHHQQVGTKALFGDTPQQVKVTSKCKPLSVKVSHLPLCKTGRPLQPCSSVVTLNSDDDSSDTSSTWGLNSGTQDDNQTDPQGTQDQLVTMADYFNVYTGLRLNSPNDLSALSLPTIDIPYHLLQNPESEEFTQGMEGGHRSGSQR